MEYYYDISAVSFAPFRKRWQGDAKPAKPICSPQGKREKALSPSVEQHLEKKIVNS